MSFFVIGRSKDTGALRLVSDETFSTRKDAVDALARMTIDDDLDSEAYVADLEAATPVFVVARAARHEAPTAEPEAAVASEPEPIPAEDLAEDVETQPQDGATVDEEETLPTEQSLAQGEAIESPEEEALEAPDMTAEPSESASTFEAPAEEPGVEEPALADVLKRAATTLEDEGIVVPESVGPAPSAETPAAAAEEGAEAPEAPEGAAESWPWENAGSPDAAQPAYVPDPLEEPAVDASTIVYAKGDEESVELSKPVYMGAYDETPTQIEPGLDQIAPQAPQAAPAAPDPSDAGPLPVSGGIIGDLEIEPQLAAPRTETAGFTAESTTAADNLSCEDCVYQNTCPNKDELTPGSCGSFQWKAP